MGRRLDSCDWWSNWQGLCTDLLQSWVIQLLSTEKGNDKKLSKTDLHFCCFNTFEIGWVICDSSRFLILKVPTWQASDRGFRPQRRKLFFKTQLCFHTCFWYFSWKRNSIFAFTINQKIIFQAHSAKNCLFNKNKLRQLASLREG